MGGDVVEGAHAWLARWPVPCRWRASRDSQARRSARRCRHSVFLDRSCLVGLACSFRMRCRWSFSSRSSRRPRACRWLPSPSRRPRRSASARACNSGRDRRRRPARRERTLDGLPVLAVAAPQGAVQALQRARFALRAERRELCPGSLALLPPRRHRQDALVQALGVAAVEAETAQQDDACAGLLAGQHRDALQVPSGIPGRRSGRSSRRTSRCSMWSCTTSGSSRPSSRTGGAKATARTGMPLAPLPAIHDGRAGPLRSSSNTPAQLASRAKAAAAGVEAEGIDRAGRLRHGRPEARCPAAAGRRRPPPRGRRPRRRRRAATAPARGRADRPRASAAASRFSRSSSISATATCSRSPPSSASRRRATGLGLVAPDATLGQPPLAGRRQ